MVPMSLTESERDRLLTLARASIAHGLAHGRPLPVNPADFPVKLIEPAATFVTLELSGRLRGCIGRLEAARPLAEDVAENAYAAAFRDSRFPPVTAAESAGLTLHISVLSPSEPLYFKSEADLIAQLRPGIDGLILSDAGRRGTFLPSVWEELPDPAEFLRHLKRKAGLPADYWSTSMKIQRYTTEMFG